MKISRGFSEEDAEYLLSGLNYNLEENRFYYKPKIVKNKYDERWNNRFEGKLAGTLSAAGYRVITVHNIQIYEHVLIWLYYNGSKSSDCVIDHLDRDPLNNDIENLREVPLEINNLNIKPRDDNQLGVRGVHLHKSSGKYRVILYYKSKRYNGGYYDNLQEAKEAYLRLRA